MAEELGVHPEALRTWVKKAEIDAGARPGTTSEDAQRIRQLEADKPRTAQGKRDPEERVGFLRGGARPPVPLICEYIDSHREEFGVEPICQALASAGVKIAPSTYYAARTRPPSARAVRDQALKAEIGRVHENNYCVLGARKMHAMRGRPEESARHGLGHVARCTVERLMRDMGLHGHRPRQVAQDDPVRTEGRMPGGPGQKTLQRLQAERAVGGGHNLRAHPVGLGVCGLCH
nr:IS3 family transposase [Actinomyces ruminicola]